MPHYVVLYKLTDQGIKNIRQTVERAKEGRLESERRGFTIRDVFWTHGQYDVVIIIEAPDELTMTAGLLNIGAAGNARSGTLHPLTLEEMEEGLRGVEGRWAS